MKFEDKKISDDKTWNINVVIPGYNISYLPHDYARYMNGV